MEALTSAGQGPCRAGLDAGGTSPPVLAFARHGLSAAACMSDAAALWLQGGMAMPAEPAG